MRLPKEKKATVQLVEEAIKKRNLASSGVLWKINCPEEFKKQPDSKKCYFEGEQLRCKWDDLHMQLICGTEKTYACFCGNVVAIKRKERKRK